MRKPRITMVLNDAGIPERLWIGKLIKRRGMIIGKVLSAKKRKDGMIEVLAQINSPDELRIIELPSKKNGVSQ
jgi:hypothetical protein